MTFAYREYLSQITGTTDYRLILRPVITIRIAGPQADARWDALVDTGADETLLPLALAEILGVELDPDFTSQAVGISGGQLTVQYGDVCLEISDGQESIAWQSTVGFVDFGSPSDEVIILGHAGCLDFFTMTFDGENAQLELSANNLLPEP